VHLHGENLQSFASVLHSLFWGGDRRVEKLVRFGKDAFVFARTLALFRFLSILREATRIDTTQA